MNNWTKLTQIGKSLNGRLQEGGINWTWMYFDRQEDADEFVRQIDANDGEHRGVYKPDARNTCYSVRYR